MELGFFCNKSFIGIGSKERTRLEGHYEEIQNIEPWNNYIFMLYPNREWTQEETVLV